VSIHPTARGFETAAAVYEAGRPGYPPAAVDLLVDRLGIGPGRRVLDLGAGTGKLTRELLARGAEVVAVEPTAGMRAQLGRAVPSDRLEIREGTAETIPLPDGSVDAATVAQAWHWFDAGRALAELHRVLRPACWLGVVFNRRDLTTPVQAAIDELLRPHRGDTPSWARHDWDGDLRATSLFAADGTAAFPWVQHLTLEGLVARVASISFVARLDERTRGRVLAATRELHAASAPAGEVDGATVVALHYVTGVHLLRRVEPS
jgi:SAM-dependent methyltransferase